MGRINYVSWWLAMGRSLRAGLEAWAMLSTKEQNAWHMAADAVINEEWSSDSTCRLQA
jgi:hypothetical protein